MRPRRQPVAGPAGGGNFYQWVLFLMLCLFVVLIVVAVTVTITVPSPAFRAELITPAPNPPTTAAPTAPPTPAPTLPNATEAPTAPPTNAPTDAPTSAPLAIVCPADVTVVLGTSLEPTYTGGPPVASGGCSTPVLQYTDSIVGTGMPSIARNAKPRATNPMLQRQRAELLQGDLVEPDPAASGSGRMPVTVAPEPLTRRHVVPARSPSFSFSNLYQSNQTQQTAATEGAILAVGLDHVVLLTHESGGWLATVYTKSLASVTSFYVHSLGSGNCSTGSSNATPQVAWDHVAQRWLLAQYAASPADTLCVYASHTLDPAGPYHALAYSSVPSTSLAQLAVWGRTYALTLDESGVTPPAKPLCVMDRTAVLAWNETFQQEIATFNDTTNVTTYENVTVATPLPGLFCAGALNPLPHLTRWTPAHAEQDPPNATSSENSGAGTPGAVFFRAVDDEYQFNETMTPLTDQLEVEHWYNLNWTSATYGAIRYKFSVLDFDQRPGVGCGAVCVPTPTTTKLGAQNGVLMPRLSYRRIPATGQESLVATLSSHSNGADVARFYWFEVRWLVPTTQQTNPIWVLYQQGVSNSSDGLHKFLPSACMDANGTVAFVYSVSNNASVYPALWATSRLGNDPNGTVRDALQLHPGALGSVIGASPAWGPHWTMACDPVESRWFYAAGAVSDLANPRVTWIDRLRVLGEIVQRTWRADDYCQHTVNCSQYILEV